MDRKKRRGRRKRGDDEGLCFSTCAVYTPFMHGAYHICIHSIVYCSGGEDERWSRDFGEGFGFGFFLVAKFGTTQWKVVKSGGTRTSPLTESLDKKREY
jgi:hypothetical protein